MTLTEHIPGVKGTQFLSTENGYSTSFQQYASSTYAVERKMRPGLIVIATGLDDIKATVKYATQKGVAISVRTGGHQYSGASSTTNANILLDMKSAFKDNVEDFIVTPTANTTTVRTSVSWSLGEFLDKLTANHLFVPTGQCTDVHLGGHVQTGGYGQLMRSFGLFGDHVRSLELIDANGEEIVVTKQSQPDLFFAILGGSPGNFGVIHHFTIEPHRDQDYAGSYGMQTYHTYSREKLNYLLDILVQMSDDDTTARNYDYTVTVLSKTWKFKDFSKELEESCFSNNPELFDSTTRLPLFSIIAVYAQWVKFSPNDKPNKDWFNKLDKGHIPFASTGMKQMDMSKIVHYWLFTSPREFNYPYVKRTFSTNSTTLAKDKWASWITDHIDEINEPDNGLFVSAQLQFGGGKYSQFRNNAGNGTAYSWRDTTVVCTIDCFHKDGAKDQAEAWEAKTDTMIGPNGSFGKQQRRLLWGSFGEWDMTKVWQFYYDNKDVYEKLQAARKKADPNATFTPNPFAVPRETLLGGILHNIL